LWEGQRISLTKSNETLSKDLMAKLHKWAGSHICPFVWDASSASAQVENGSCFFIDFDDRLFMVTAAHVYAGYLCAKRKSAREVACRIGHLNFDPQARLRDCDRDKDIATFDFTYAELATVQTQAVVATPSPPPEPPEDLNAFIGGFPARGRRLIGEKVAFGRYLALTPITAVTDRQLIFRFNRENWVGIDGIDLPAPGAELGGISGGPVLLPADDNAGSWSLFLGGIISQAHTSFDYETVVAVRSDFINRDGSISPI